MEKLSPETKRIIKKFSSTIIALLALMIIIYLTTRNKENANTVACSWYWYGAFAYFILTGAIIFEIDDENINGFMGKVGRIIYWLSMCLAIIMLAGFIIHFFYAFPYPLQAIFGWSSFWLAIIMFILNWIHNMIIADIEDEDEGIFNC